jgi:hypothetical protein
VQKVNDEFGHKLHAPKFKHLLQLQRSTDWSVKWMPSVVWVGCEAARPLFESITLMRCPKTNRAMLAVMAVEKNRQTKPFSALFFMESGVTNVDAWIIFDPSSPSLCHIERKMPGIVLTCFAAPPVSESRTFTVTFAPAAYPAYR